MAAPENAASAAPLKLPSRLDTAACSDLVSDIGACRGAPLTLCAAEVSFLGAMAAEILVAAQREWRAAGSEFAVISPSEAFQRGASLLGIPDAEIGTEAAR